MQWIIVIAAFLNIIDAFVDAYRIKKREKKDGKDIDHTPGWIIYTIVCAIIALLFGNIFYSVPMLFIRPVVFDPVLNVLRGKYIFYVSRTTTSVIDRIENKITKDGFHQWLIWIGLTVLSIWLVSWLTNGF